LILFLFVFLLLIVSIPFSFLCHDFFFFFSHHESDLSESGMNKKMKVTKMREKKGGDKKE